MVEVLKLPQEIDRLSQRIVIMARKGQVGDREIGIGVAVILMVVHLNGGVIPQFVTAHHLNVELHRAERHTFANPLKLVEGIGTRIDKVVDRPTSEGIAQTVVDGFITDQGVLIGGHKIEN